MSSLPTVVAPLADKVPTDNDVVAGWVGFAVFMFLVVAVALLCWSFTRHLRKARTNFGVVNRSTALPVAGTPEGDAALAEALVGPERSDADRAVPEPVREDPASGGRHRGTPQPPTS